MCNFKADLAKCFSLAANQYDEYANIQNKTSKKLANIILSSNISPKTILDIGAGTGLTSLALMKHYPKAKYTLCDISEKMLDEAMKKSLNSCVYIVADAEKYNFRSHDLCVSNLAVQWFNNLDTFIYKAMGFSKIFAFSAILHTSFYEYNRIFMDKGEPSPLLRFHSLDEILTTANKYGDIVCSGTETYCKNFENAVGVARYFKNIGANSSNLKSNKTRSILLGSRKKIMLNYDVVFIAIQKP